jgi:hypothetical protein
MNFTVSFPQARSSRRSERYPLLTNDKTLTPAQVLEAHKGQPLERRSQQTQTVHELTPVLLKNPGRIEALFTLYFPGLLVQALIECELRTAMRRARITELPLYPEERRCKRPTTEQVLRLFSHTERHVLLRNGRLVQVFRSSTPNSPTCRSRYCPSG